MKKRLFYLLFILVLLVGCSNDKKNEEYEGYAIEINYCGDEKEINSDDLFFTSYDDFSKYIQDMNRCGTDVVKNKYDQDYFDDKSLAIVYVVTGSGAVKVEYNGYEIIDDKVKVKYERKSIGEVGTADMHGYYVIVEVPKTVEGIIK